MLADSVVTNEDYAKRAAELGHSVLSSCEHGNQGNYRECALLAEKYGLRWRYVSEAYFVKDRREKDNTNCHIILAAKTAKGVGDLNFALSEANISGFYYRPRMDMELLLSLDPKDVFVTTACIAGVFKYGEEEAEKLILRFAQHFRDSFMLEVQYHDTEKQREVNQFLLKLYRRHGIPLIMGTDSHFIYPEDAALRQQRLEANHIRYEDESGWYMDYPTGAEAYRRFQTQGVLSDAQIHEAIENTNVFLTFEDVVFDKRKKLPSIYPNLSQEERNQKYLDAVHAEWEKYSAGMTDEEKAPREAGIAYETETICSTGIRVSEVRYITVEAAKNGKTEIALKGKIRTILLPAKLCRKLLKFAARQKTASGAIFRTKSGKAMSRYQIWSKMKKLCARAGVDAGKVFPHNLRHLFATAFYRAYKDIVKLADVLGHSSIETTRIYLVTSMAEHRRQLEQLKLVS